MAGVPPSKIVLSADKSAGDNCPPALARSQELLPVREVHYSVPSQTEREDFWPEHRPSQDFSNISSLHDNFSYVASEDMRRPLPEFEEEIDIEEGLEQPRGDEDPPQEPEQMGPEFDDSFHLEDADNLRRVMGDINAATPPVLSVTMPWELPGISLVLGDDTPIVPTPVLHPVPILEDEPPIVSESHRTVRVDRIRGSFHECIDFKLTLADSEILSARWDRALEKWYLIFARGRSGWPEGYDIYDIVAKRGLSCQAFAHCSGAAAKTLS